MDKKEFLLLDDAMRYTLGSAANWRDLVRKTSLSFTKTWLIPGNCPVISANISSMKSFFLHLSTSSLLLKQKILNKRREEMFSFFYLIGPLENKI